MLLLIGAAFAQDFEPPPPEWLPNDTTAVLLSMSVGFGAGHFYAKQPDPGKAHAMLQGLGVGLVAIGAATGGSVWKQNNTEARANQIAAASAIAGTGMLIFSLDRLVDIGTAPRSVRRYVWGDD